MSDEEQENKKYEYQQSYDDDDDDHVDNDETNDADDTVSSPNTPASLPNARRTSLPASTSLSSMEIEAALEVCKNTMLSE